MTSESRLLTLCDCIRWVVSRFHAADLFFDHGTDNAWGEARHLALDSLHLPWEISDSYLDCRLEGDERAELAEILQRRIEEWIPAACLLGEAWFCGTPFSVDERILVPRPPIAKLIEQRLAPWLSAEPAQILDLCAGSGCIGIACAYAFGQTEVVLTDLSFDVLEVANVNTGRHGLDERVYTVQGDGFAGLPDQRFDLIVSNPPCVDTEDFADMPAEFYYGPELGLACGGDDLGLVRRMLTEAADHLNKKGLLIVKVGNSEIRVQALYPEVDFTWLEFRHDGHGMFMLSAAQCHEHRELFRLCLEKRSEAAGAAGSVSGNPD